MKPIEKIIKGNGPRGQKYFLLGVIGKKNLILLFFLFSFFFIFFTLVVLFFLKVEGGGAWPPPPPLSLSLGLHPKVILR
jgi:hypothetical protein